MYLYTQFSAHADQNHELHVCFAPILGHYGSIILCIWKFSPGEDLLSSVNDCIEDMAVFTGIGENFVLILLFRDTSFSTL